MKKKTHHYVLAASVFVLVSITLFAKHALSPTPQNPQAQDLVNTPTSDKTVPLAITLPKPVFGGTPLNLTNIPNLKPLRKRDRPPFLAPSGTSNVALNKPVTGSNDPPTLGEFHQITDGDKEYTEGNLVSLAPEGTGQFVTIDLESPHHLYAVLLWHNHQAELVFKDVLVQISHDPDFIEEVVTLFNNDHDNSSGSGIGPNKNYIETFHGKLVDAKGQQAQYVRLYSHGNNCNDMNQYLEVEVFGKPVIH